MFKIKKYTPQGQCAAMRCKAPAADLLCPKHEGEWLEAGSPALAADAPKEDALALVKEGLTTERQMLQKVLERVQSLPLETPAQLEALGTFLGRVQTQNQELDTKRKAIVGPYNETVKEVNAWFKPLTDLCKSILASGKVRMEARLLELQAEQDRALKAIEAGAGRAPAEVFELAHTPVETAGNVSARTEWTWSTVDAGAIPEMYWMRVLNTAMIDQAVKTSGEACAIPGIKVEKRLAMTVRKT